VRHRATPGAAAAPAAFSAAGRGRIAGIEGVRGIAAVSILVYHVWLYAAPDQVSVDVGHAGKLFDNLRAGVTLFFVLSGFLLYRPFAAAAIGREPLPSVRKYARNRALRILPAYWVILLATAAIAYRELLTRPLQLLANLTFAQDYVTGYIAESNGGVGIVPAWSLAIEVVFYACLPALGVLALLAARRGRSAGPAVGAASVPVLLLLAIGVASKILARTILPGRVWEAAFPMHADWFAAGMALAVAHVQWQRGRLALPRRWAPAAVALAVALGGCSIALFYHGVLDQDEYQSPIAFAFALLLATVVFAPRRAFVVRVLDSRVPVAVGLASYSLFLWHDPLLRVLRAHGLTHAGVGGLVYNLVLVGALAGVASALTYLFVERPALALKRGSTKAAPAPAPAPPEPGALPAASAVLD
jgi:peptidoglycan/LPS O-acetylase OafA/YrhL